MPYCNEWYFNITIRLIKEKQFEKASKIIEMGRVKDPTNKILMFSECYLYYIQHNHALSFQVWSFIQVYHHLVCWNLLFIILPSRSLRPLFITVFLLKLVFFHFSFIRQSSHSQHSDSSLLIQSANYLLKSSNIKYHIISALTFLKARQYHKVVEVCNSIEEREKNDLSIINTSKQLLHLANKLIAKEIKPSQLCQHDIPMQPSLFQEDSVISRLLSGSIAEEDLEQKTIESQLVSAVLSNENLSIYQKAIKVIITTTITLHLLVILFESFKSLSSILLLYCFCKWCVDERSSHFHFSSFFT